jgi:hypothetical protein
VTQETTEPDTETASDDDVQKPSDKEPTRRVMLSCNEQVVQIEGPDSLDEIAKLAAYFWLLVSPPKQAGLGFSAGSTLITERSTPDLTDDGKATA